MCLSVDYGQRHQRELTAAAEVAKHFALPHLVLDLRTWGRLLTGSALTDPRMEVPQGHYADPSMKVTVVPNRNAVLLMAAAGVAMTDGCNHVLTAVHSGDHPIYPDCRPEFIESAARTMWFGTDRAVRLEAPFLHLDKAAIVRLGSELGAPMHLSWSCYEGDDVHCGQCGTCVERREAFSLAGIPDPTTYR
jgi:queuosine biosynthesis protein QueC